MFVSQKVRGRDSAWTSLGTSDWAHIVGRPKTKRNAVLWTLGAWFVWRRREEERPIAGFQPRGPSCTAHSLSHFFFDVVTGSLVLIASLAVCLHASFRCLAGFEPLNALVPHVTCQLHNTWFANLGEQSPGQGGLG